MYDDDFELDTREIGAHPALLRQLARGLDYDPYDDLLLAREIEGFNKRGLHVADVSEACVRTLLSPSLNVLYVAL